jgi:hypothetical protein
MRLGPVRLPLLCAAWIVGCGEPSPAPSITGISPARGYTDSMVRLSIDGLGFVPTFQIDLGSGHRVGQAAGFSGRAGDGTTPQPVTLREFDWLDQNSLTAWMDPGLPAGLHAIEVTDPRGQTVRKPMAFWSLGPDDEPPVVVIEKPAPMTPITRGTLLDVSVTAADRAPGTLASLVWEVWTAGGMIQTGPCRFEEDHARARCDLQVVVPSSLGTGDELTLRAVAIDRSAAANRSEQAVTLVVRSPPSLAAVSPTRGGVVGGTDLVIHGDGFVPGTQVYVGDLLMLPGGGVVMDEHTIYGRAPAHGEGLVTVQVRTPIGDTQLPRAFSYELPPQIEAILPERGNRDGGTSFRVRGHGFTESTRIYFGPSLVAAHPCEEQHFMSSEEIIGAAPAGHGITSVWAFDAELGWSRLADGFQWSDLP